MKSFYVYVTNFTVILKNLQLVHTSIVYLYIYMLRDLRGYTTSPHQNIMLFQEYLLK